MSIDSHDEEMEEEEKRRKKGNTSQTGHWHNYHPHCGGGGGGCMALAFQNVCLSLITLKNSQFIDLKHAVKFLKW